MKEYIIGTELKENEYLLKMKDTRTYVFEEDKYVLKTVGKSGFLTKLTQKQQIPKKFKDWSDSPIYVHEETYKSGWKISGDRIGESQQWCVLIHPDGFTIEIYLSELFKIIDSSIIRNGVIEGEFYWSDEHKLIKKNEVSKN